MWKFAAGDIKYTSVSLSKLKGQCHEMNTFLKALKIKAVLSVDAPMVLNLFCILIVRKLLLSSACFYENTY